MPVRLLGLAALLVLLIARSRLAGALTAEGPLQAAAFHGAWGLAVLAALAVALRGPDWFTALRLVASRHPWRSALLLVNVLVMSLMVLNVMTQWGVIALLLAGGALITLDATRDAERRRAWLSRTVRLSPLSFGVLYTLLAAGEIWLRFHPHQVGGGGGGNPAHRVLYDGLYDYNSWGLRDDEFSETPDTGTFRILVLGDSVTFGQGVPHDAVYPTLLEEHRGGSGDAGAGGTRLEVINAGRPDMDTADELDWLKEHGLQFEPDLVLVQFYLNDIRARATAQQASASSWVDRIVKHPFVRSWCLFALRYRFDRLPRLALPDNAPRDFTVAALRQVETNSAGWRACSEALRGFAQHRDETTLPVLVVLFPHPGIARESVSHIHAAVAELCASVDLPVLDLLDSDELAQMSETVQTVSPSDHHPSAAYHRVAADAILEAMESRGLLPPSLSDG